MTETTPQIPIPNLRTHQRYWIRGQLQNHEFCSMEGEYILDEVEGKAAESVTMGNHNF